jgi:hypothetical protein
MVVRERVKKSKTTARAPRRWPDMDRFDIARRRKPAIQGGLSSTVLYEDKGYVDIRFNTYLIHTVGIRMPRGVSAQDPAFMLVRYNKIREEFQLLAQYLNEIGQNNEQYYILSMQELPKWLLRVKPL